MPYRVKEIFYTLQGEGINTGKPAVFCRFSGCNLWSGREEDRLSATCRFCDTDFVGVDGSNGGIYEKPEDLCTAISAIFPKTLPGLRPLVVCTGGEPLLQLDDVLVETMHRFNFQVAVETNGTLVAPRGLDWITVSPKRGTILEIKSGDELKLVFPQTDIDPKTFETLEFRYFLLQPKDGSDREENTRLALNYCLNHPLWRLSLQTHKYVGIP